MKNGKHLLASVLSFAGLMALTANAEVSMNSTRITAPDTEELAEFYKSAFGMHEVQRIPLGTGIEIMLNFGATVEEAMANPGAQVVLFPRAENEPEDTTPHLILNVTDMDETVAALKAAGGSMEQEPFGFGDTGILIGMGIDPVGNHFELLYFPPEE
jgi:predicted enzyme related to lactoylglutathione lyase